VTVLLIYVGSSGALFSQQLRGGLFHVNHSCFLKFGLDPSLVMCVLCSQPL
jgi:hypothetical protein